MSSWSKRLLSVMMPAYNEGRTIEAILGHVLDRPEVGEVIVVDDSSHRRDLGHRAASGESSQ